MFSQKNSVKLLNSYKQKILTQSPQQENLPLIYLPFRKFDFEQLHNKHFPFWNPYVFGGAPFFADDQSAVLSVYTLVGSLFPYTESFLVVSILKLIITGIGMYLLLSLFSLSIYACLIGSITWMFSAFMMTFHIHHTAADAGSFIPWFFYFFERLVRSLDQGKGISLSLAGLIVSVGLSLFAGHAETTIVGSIGLSIYALTKVFMSKNSMRIIFYTFIGLLFGYLLASVQLIPFLVIVLKSEPYYLRSTAVKVLRSMPLWTVIMWFAPSFYFLREGGTLVLRQSTTYIGITSLLLAIFSISVIKRYYKTYLPFFTTMIVTAGIGYVIPPFSWLLKIPIIRLGGAFRFLAITEFSLAVLAGFGMNALYSSYGSKNGKKSNTLNIVIIPMLTLFTVGFLIGVKFNMFPSITLLNTVWIKSFSPINIGITSTEILILIILIIITLLIILKFYSVPYIAGSCLVILTIVDLFIYGMLGMEYNPLLTSQSLEPSSPIIKTLMQYGSPDYTFYTNNEVIRPNIGMLYGLRDFRGFDIVVSRRYQKFLSALFTDTVPKPDASGEYHDLPSYPDPVIASIAGIKYLIFTSTTKADSPYYKLITTYKELSLWKNTQAKPILYLADAIQSVADNKDALNILLKHDPLLLHTSLVTGINESGSFDNSKVKLKRIKDRAGEHIVKVDADSNGFLVINEPYYQGWHAYIDGKEVPMYHVNYLFQGIKLPPGNYTVKIVYMPRIFYLGLIVSFLTLFVVVSMIVFKIK
jgi:hypothetical protein